MKFCANYGVILRVIGQDLERRGITAFDMEYQGDNICVSVRDNPSGLEGPQPGEASKTQQANLEKPSEIRCRKAKAPRQKNCVAFKQHYTIEEIKRLEQDARAKRSIPDRIPSGHSMSEILRTIGTFVVYEKGRLHSLSFRHDLVTVVYDTAAGRRTTDLFALSKRARRRKIPQSKSLYQLVVGSDKF